MSSSPASISELINQLGDYSGYRRQEAVARAAELADPAALPMLAERLNDWVPQVRDAARVAILELLVKTPAGPVIGILPSILALRQKSRWPHEEWVAHFEAALLRHVAPDLLLEAIQGPNLKAGRACFDVLNRHPLFEQSVLVDLALASRVDVAVAGTAANMIHRLPPPLQQARYAAAMQSRFGRIRAVGIAGLLRHTATDNKRELAQAHLLDAQAWVRQSAIAFLLADQFDVKAYYRARLANPALGCAQLCIALTALAGLRDKSDVALVRPYTRHATAMVRQAALSAWLRLAEEHKDEIALLALSDEAASIRRFALAMVRRRGAYIPFDSLQADLLARQEWELLLEFARFGQWNWLEAVARIAIAAGPSIDAVRPALQRELARWADCHSSFTRPTAAQAQYLTSEKVRTIFDAVYGVSPSLNALVDSEMALVAR